MKVGKTFAVKFRRRRSQKTNFKKRLGLLKSKKTRLVVRRTNANNIVQLINIVKGNDATVIGINSKKLSEFGWNGNTKNISAAYLTGLLAGKMALKKNIESAVLDIGLNTPIKGSRLFAALKGVIDSGIQVNAGEEAFPSDERISGKHIEDYAKKLSEEELQKKFGAIIKKGFNVKEFSKEFEKVKTNILNLK